MSIFNLISSFLVSNPFIVHFHSHDVKEAGDEVENAHDLELLERLRLGRDSEDDIPPSDNVDYVKDPNSDDEDYGPANPDHDDYF